MIVFIIIITIAAFGGLQVWLTIHNLNKIHLLKDALNKLDELKNNYDSVQFETNNEIDREIVEETNDFLRLRKNNLLLDFSLLKEKIEKKITSRVNEIEGATSLPLYIALMATVSGIIISLFSLKGDNNSLLTHIAITMIATLLGVLFYFLQTIKFNSAITEFEHRLARYWKIIENFYGLNTSNSFVHSIELLQKNLYQFNERFEESLLNFNQGFVKTVGDLGDVIDTNLKATQELNEVVTKIQQINLEKIIGNYKLLEEIEFIVTKLQKFGVWFEKMENILLIADKMTFSLNEAMERTNNLELAVNNFNNATTFHTDIAKFLKEHLTKLEDYKKYSEETANKSFAQFNEQLQQTNAQLITNYKVLEENLTQIQQSFARDLAKQLYDTFSTTKIEEFQKQNDEFVKNYGKIVKDISERFEGLVEQTENNIDEIIKNFGRGSVEISNGLKNISEEVQQLQKSIKAFEEIEQINSNLASINQNVAELSGKSDNGWAKKLNTLEHLNKLGNIELLKSINSKLDGQKKDFEKLVSVLSKLEEIQIQNQELIEENQKLIQQSIAEKSQVVPTSKTTDLKVIEGNFSVPDKNPVILQDSNEILTPDETKSEMPSSTPTQTKIQLGILIILLLILLVLGFWAYKSIYDSPITSSSSQLPEPTQTTQVPDSSFFFQAETNDNPDNFNTKIEVTVENIQRLYKNYKVEEISRFQDLTLYKAYTGEPKSNERYFTRLILMKNGKQVAEELFYDLQLDFFIPRESDFLLGFNSPQKEVLKNFNGAKIILVNWDLEQLFEKTFKYKTYPFTSLSSLKLNNNGFEAEVINLDLNKNNIFDKYIAYFDDFGNIYKSFKQEIKN